MVERGIPILCEVDMSEELRKRALALYKPPFSHHCGYILDSNSETVADSVDPSKSVILRVRGWGRIGKLETPEKLQDMVGDMVAEALNQYWEKQNGLVPLPDGEGWIRWAYSDEVPFPVLDRDPYVNVQWSDGTVDTTDWPISYFHEDGGSGNSFNPNSALNLETHKHYLVAYKVVQENADFEESERIAAENLAAEESLLP